jgi:signal peptidase I
MEPTLRVGDHLLVNKFVYGPARYAWEDALPRRPIRRGDLVVFRPAQDPEHDFIKRCLALPGDRVAMVDKVLSVNDRPLDESSYAVHFDDHIYPDSPLLEEALRGRDNFRSTAIPMDHLFCLGDNRDSSQDSRAFGPVPRSHVRGRALIVYWSAGAWRRIGHLVR